MQLAEANETANLDSLKTAIEDLEKTFRKYKLRRSNLLEALELGEFGKDEVLDRLNNLKRLQHEDEMKLSDLLKIRENLTSLTEAKIKLSQLYDRAIENLHCRTPELKRLALDALDIQVYASTERVEIQGVIPLELPTIEQTSA